jgi:hypothetical protein
MNQSELKEFIGFRKIPRLTRECVITEKIDGTNGVIHIGEDGEFQAGSRTRWLGDHEDNHGFWHWAMENKEELMKLGKGYHYGEWWGSGINRGYGLLKGEKRFSLFNTARWSDDLLRPKCCSVVPVITEGIFDTNFINNALAELIDSGSRASKGFMKPEGIVIYHKAGNMMFKKTIEKDDEWKGKSNEPI